MNHYERLKVTQDAPPEVIRAAYRALAGKLHPDRNGAKGGPSEQSHEQMVALNNSYLVLMDPAAREAYDTELRATPRPAPTAPGEFDATAPDTQPQTRVDIDWPAGSLLSPSSPWHRSQPWIGPALLSMGVVMAVLCWFAWKESQRLEWGEKISDVVPAAMESPSQPLANDGTVGQPGGGSADAMVALKTLPGFAELPPEVRAQLEAVAQTGPRPMPRPTDPLLPPSANAAAQPRAVVLPDKLEKMSNEELLAQLPDLLGQQPAPGATERASPEHAGAPLPGGALGTAAAAPAARTAQAHPLDGKRLDGMRLDLHLRGLPAGRLRSQPAAPAR